jgi:Zn-dependent protease with chaperone function
MEIETSLDTERQQEAKEYARIRRRLLVVDLALGAAFVLVWLLSGASLGLRNQVMALTDQPLLTVALYAAVFGAVYGLLDAPLSYYSGFVLPHRYGLSTQTLRAWLWDQVKGAAIGGVLGLVLLEVMYTLLRASPGWWWLWTALVMLFFSVILSNLAPVLIMPLFYKFVPLDDADLAERLTRLSEQAGAHVRGVYRFDMSSKTVQANAAVAGLGNTRRIILGDTLLNHFTADEIETILAHELGHHVHGDLGKGILVGSALTLIGLWLAGQALSWGVTAFGLPSLADVAAMPLLALALGAFELVTMPLNNGYSRWRESLADRYALETTRKPSAFASAMTRLANQNLSEADPERWVEVLLYSHPAISRRVAMAKEFGSGSENDESQP